MMAFKGEYLTPRMIVPIALVLGGAYLVWHLARIRAAAEHSLANLLDAGRAHAFAV